MPKKLLAFFGLFAIIAVLILNSITGTGKVEPAKAAALPAVPAGLKTNFTLGLSNGQGKTGWMSGSGAAWDARYQYLSGGVNTSGNWKTWQWNQLPPGQFALDYMNESLNSGYLPVFSWYQLLQSSPSSGSTESDRDFNNLNNASTMNAYFSDFKLLMDKAKTFGKPVIVHVEPDLWGFLQMRSSNPAALSASVGSSGYGDVAAYPNTVAGFAQALVGLRNKYAPNVLLAYHISPWSSTAGDLTSNTGPNFNVLAAAQQTANFYLATGANFDLFFYDIADRDAALYASWGNPSHWWDVNNVTYPNFNRFNQFALAITTLTGKRGMLWQVPVGNTLYKSVNNTNHHWQDNRVQYYLGNGSQHIQDLANSGIIGIMFGAGDGNTTGYDDIAGDGITNPTPINGNNLTALYADDDGGYLRLQAQSYYSRGAVALPGSSGTAPVATATPTPTTAPTAIPTSAPLPVGSGTGLSASYFNNKTLSGTPVLQRVDATVNFSWGSGSPGAGVNVDNFSARWTGQVTALSTGTYNFCTQSDDGVRLWVNGVQLVSDWTDHGTTEDCGNISLTQGQAYSLKMEYYENGGDAVAKLLWQGPGVAKAIIPRSQLVPSAGTGVTATQAPTATATPAQSAPANWVLSSAVSGPLTGGSATTISSRFTAPSNANGSFILDVEVYNVANNAKVAQWTPTQTLTPGQLVTLNNTTSLGTGKYIIRLGVFTTGWSMLAWQDSITFQVN